MMRVWLLRTPSHDRLVLSGERPEPPSGNYSVADVTEAIREFIILNFDWVAQCDPGDDLT